MIKPAFEILNQRGTPMFFSDVFANRPAPGIIGRIFISTDTNLIYRDTGTTWNLIGGGTATIGGTIAAGQVAYGTALNTIGGTGSFVFDDINNRLGVGGSASNALTITAQTVGDGIVLKGQTGLNIFSVTRDGTSANTSELFQYAGGSIRLAIRNTSNLSYFNGGNFAFGSNVDNGLRLQVYGDAFIRGTGASNTTNALLIENSTTNKLFTISNNGFVRFGNAGSTAPTFFSISSSQSINDLSGTNLSYFNYTTNQNAAAGCFAFTGEQLQSASSDQINISSIRTFSPTSGSAAHVNLLIRPTINQSGGANGITRGLFINPTLTSAADWRSIEWNNNAGWGLYGAGTSPNYLNGNLLLGTTTSTGDRIIVTGSSLLNGAVRAVGDLRFGVSTGSQINATTGVDDITTLAVNGLRYRSALNPGDIGTDHIFGNLQGSPTNTSGTRNLVLLSRGFTPTSGTGIFNNLSILGTINQTGGANGITRGLFISPTLTAAADWRSIEWSNNTGWGLYGAGSAANYLNGALLVGQTTPVNIEKFGVYGSSPGGQFPIRIYNTATTINTQSNILLTTATSSGGPISSVISSIATDTIGSIALTFTNSNLGVAGERMRLSPLGNLLIGHTTEFTAAEKLQVTGTEQIKDTRTYSTGAIQSSRLEKNLTIPSGASISGGSTISNEVLAGTTTIQGNINIPNSSPFAGIYASNLYSFSAGSLTLTSSQAAGTRAISQIAAQNYFGGSFSGTFTNVASMQIGAFLNNSTGSITPVITNAYQLLINDINEASHTFTIANRWGIYQEGSNDRNYLAGKTLVGSSTDTGEQFQLTGSIRINNQLSGTAGGSSGQHLIINCDGTIYKIALLNN